MEGRGGGPARIGAVVDKSKGSVDVHTGGGRPELRGFFVCLCFSLFNDEKCPVAAKVERRTNQPPQSLHPDATA